MQHNIVGDWLKHRTSTGTWLMQYTIIGDWLIHDMIVCNQSMHHKIVCDQSMHHVTTMFRDISVSKARFIRKDVSVFSGVTPNNQNSMCEQRAMLCAESLLSFGLEFLSSSLLTKKASIKKHRIRIGLLFYVGVKLGLPH